MSVPVANGALILKERSALESLVGKEAVERGLMRVSAEVRDAYENMTSMTRIPTDFVEAVYYAVAEEVGRDPLALHREIVREGVEDALKSIWRIFLRFTSDAAIVRRTPVFFSKGISQGTLESQMLGRGRAEIRLVGWPEASDMQINGIKAATQAVLECSGRKGVRLRHDRTIDGCRIEAEWRV